MILIGEAGVGVRGRRGELSFVRADGMRLRVEVGGDCSALAAGAGVVVAGVGDEGRVVWLDTEGAVIGAWPPLGSRISALAVASDGRVAVGTYDDVLEVGDMAGRFAPGIELEHVPAVDSDLWYPCTRGVGFLADGAVVAVAGTGHVHVLGRDLDQRVHVQHDVLAFEDTVDILALGGGRFLAASDRLSLVVEPDGRVDAPMHDFTARSRDGLVYLREGRLFVLGPDGRVRCEHDAPPGARALDLDDGVLVVGCSDGTVRWLDPDSGVALDARQVLATAVLELVAYADLLAVRGDGDQLVVAGAERAWPAPLEARALEPARLLELGPGEARWSEDGSAIVVRGEPLRVHAADDGRELASWPGEQPMAQWSAHGTYIAYYRHHIDVYDAATLARRGGGPVPSDNLSLRAVLPSGTLLASVAGMIVVAPDGALHSIDTGARQRDGLLCYSGNHGPVGRDGTRAAVAPTDRRGILLSLPDGAWLTELDAVNGAWVFSPDGERLLEARSGALYDASDGVALGTCGGGGSGAAAWACGGAAIVRCEPDGAWWCAADGRRLHALPGAAGGHPYVSPGGTHVVVVCGARLLCLDGRDGQVRGELEVPTTVDLVLLEFVGEDRVLASPTAMAPADPTLWLVDPAACRVVAPLALTTDDRLHQDCPLRWGERVVLAPVRGQVHAFELADGALSGTLDLGTAELRALDVSVRGELLVAASDGRVRVL